MEVYSRPYDESYPVVCMDEKPVQFFADFRKGFRSKKDGVQYEDYQYIRNGTASIFLFTEPLAGWRYADAQERRTAHDWAKQIEWLLTEQYPVAKRVVLVMDNLNTHSIASLYATFPPQHARELAERLEIHYTPKHGSWLDIAEIELSALGRQSISRKDNCLDNAVMENCFGLLKTELLYLQDFDSMEHFKAELMDYLDYYNNRRIKLKLKGLTPAQHRYQTLQVA